MWESNTYSAAAILNWACKSYCCIPQNIPKDQSSKQQDLKHQKNTCHLVHTCTEALIQEASRNVVSIPHNKRSQDMSQIQMRLMARGYQEKDKIQCLKYEKPVHSELHTGSHASYIKQYCQGQYSEVSEAWEAVKTKRCTESRHY